MVEKIESTSLMELIEKFKIIRVRLCQTADYITKNRQKTNESLSIYNILRVLPKELDKVIVNNFDNEILAWSTRNIFELNIILRNILEKNLLDKWISYRISDEIEVLKGLKSYSDSENTNELTTRIKELEDYASANSIKLIGHTDTRSLAKAIGIEDEYIAFFKFYSKYVHPTSWSINLDDATKNSLEYKNILLLNFQKYLLDTEYRINTYLNIK